MREEGEILARDVATGESVRVSWREGILIGFETSGEKAPEDLWIAPPLFDVQVNGYGGVDFQQDDLTIADLEKAAASLRRDGCSRFLLTLITDEWTALTSRLR